MQISKKIIHDGKGIPVAPDTKVFIACRDGYDEFSTGYSIPIRASYWKNDDISLDMWMWNINQQNDCDIIEYYVVTEVDDG